MNETIKLQIIDNSKNTENTTKHQNTLMKFQVIDEAISLYES